MEKVRFKREGYFPLRKLKLHVNNQQYLLSGNDEITIDLPSKQFEIDLRMDWWHSNQKIAMSGDEKAVIIKHCFSNTYFFVGIPLLLAISILTYLQKVSTNLLVIFVLVFVLSQVYYLLFKPRKYFEVIKF